MDFLIIGFFRSGTTFLGNILNSNEKSHCVLDPFIFFMKIFRNKIKSKYFKKKINLDNDLENFFLANQKEKRFHNYIKNKATFNEKITKKELILHDKLIKLNKLYQHPDINKIKVKLNLKSFKNTLIYYIKEFYKISKNKNKNKFGIKISWCEEYIPVFLRSFTELKVIYIIRNLNDCINSALNSENLLQTAVRPFLYYILYWKKSFYFSHLNKKKILIIKYEDLKNNFNYNINKINKFCNIPNKEIKLLKDQYGNAWKNNSSFKFTKLENKRLYKSLNNKQKKLINYFCYDELLSLGYETKKIKNYTKKQIINDLKYIDKKFKFDRKYKKFTNYEKILKKLN